MSTTTWSDVQAKARVPGSFILTQWRAEREAARVAVRNDDARRVTYSDDVMEAFGVNRAASGVGVTPTTAMRVSSVFACVQLISGAISTMPVHLYQNTKDGRERVDDPLWWMLNEQPGPAWTAASMWESIVIDMLLRESGFVFIGRGPMGQARELIKLPWTAVHVEGVLDANGARRLKYFVRDGDRTYGVDPADMLHFPGFGFDGARAMSVIRWAAQNAAGTAMAMDQYAGRFFADGAHHSMILEAPGKMGPEQITSLQTAYANKHSGLANAHRLPLVLTEGLKATQVSITAEDAQLLEARRFQVTDIARAFGVPPHMIGETSASTSWGSGIEQMSRGFVRFTLQPHLVRIEQELNRKLFRTAKRFAEFNRDAALQGDSKAEGEAFKAALGGPGAGPGWMSVDEVRRFKNLPPVGGAAAKPFYPDPKAPAPTQTQTTNKGNEP
jgi:HK97 family phage portal protein